MSATKPYLLITGATGFIGSSLVHYFDKMPYYRVIATGRSETKGKLFTSTGILFQPADLTKERDLINLSIKPDLIVHTAGFAAPWGLKRVFYEHNVVLTKNLLEYALRKSVNRFIYISSSSIYSSLSHQFNVTEDQLPKKFVNHYAESKYQAEQCVLEAGKKGLPVIILRPRAVIGAGDTTILPRLIQAHKHGRLRKISQSVILSDITTITNLIEAVRLSLSSTSSATGKTFNITDGKPVLLWTMIDELLRELKFPPLKGELSWPMALAISSASEFVSKLLNREPALPRYVVSLLGRSLTLNIEKARNLLHYNPVQTTEQGVSDYIRYYRNQNYDHHGRKS
ncbi:MAG: NAD(P)-dependent oxidoreductase [Bacteroidota bacterium]